MSRVARGDLWMVDLNRTSGREQAGTRPALVISVDDFNQSRAELVIVLPITSREKRIRSHVEVKEGEGGLAVRSFIKCEDIRSISVGRLKRRIGSVPLSVLDAVADRLQILLGL